MFSFPFHSKFLLQVITSLLAAVNSLFNLSSPSFMLTNWNKDNMLRYSYEKKSCFVYTLITYYRILRMRKIKWPQYSFILILPIPKPSLFIYNFQFYFSVYTWEKTPVTQCLFPRQNGLFLVKPLLIEENGYETRQSSLSSRFFVRYFGGWPCTNPGIIQ